MGIINFFTHFTRHSLYVMAAEQRLKHYALGREIANFQQKHAK